MIWQQLGFIKCPYFWEELDVSEDCLALFVGRAKEGRKFTVNISDGEGATVIVGGAIGVGKTSFVNYNQYVLYKGIEVFQDFTFPKPKLLPSLRKIQLRDGDPIESIYLKILSGCIFSIQHICKLENRRFPKSLEEIREYVSQVVTSGTGHGVGISAFGFGANYTGPGSKSVVDPGHSREMTFLELLTHLNDVAREEFKVDGIMIPVNNLDIVSPEYLKSTLNYLRDSLFTMKHFWWVLLGASGLYSYVRSQIPRLAGVITGSPIELGPLSTEELEQLLSARLKLYSLSGYDAESPVPVNIIKYLYRESAGDIRFTFQVANDIVKRVFYDFPSVTRIEEELAAREIARITLEEFQSGSLNELERKIAFYIIEHPEIKELSTNHFGALGFKNSEECVQVLEELVSKRFLTRDTPAGGHVVYSPRGFLSLARTVNLSRYVPSGSAIP